MYVVTPESCSATLVTFHTMYTNKLVNGSELRIAISCVELLDLSNTPTKHLPSG